MEDVRYSELLFLQALQRGELDAISGSEPSEAERFRLPLQHYRQMVTLLAEELYVEFEDSRLRKLIWRLRGETQRIPSDVSANDWDYARDAIDATLSRPPTTRLRLTYRGLRRIDELRDLLKRDRVLEDFGILLSIRYLDRDLRDALNRPAETSVSVIRADMDDFKRVNEERGHAAGDEVMKAYLSAVRDAVGPFGTCYRGTGDETVALIIGQAPERVRAIAEELRRLVEQAQVTYDGAILPGVTASVGFATSLPGPRSREIERLADDAQRAAKVNGKNCVVEAQY